MKAKENNLWDEFCKYYEEERNYCDKLKNDEKDFCKQINDYFYDYVNKIYDNLKELKLIDKDKGKKIDFSFQTTPIIGYSDTAYKKGGVVIIGYNEHKGKDADDENKDNDEKKRICPKESHERNYTNETRDKLLDCYQYYTFFTQDDYGLDLKKCFDGNVKFVELIPIRTKGTKDLNKVLDELKKKGEDKYNLSKEKNVFQYFLLNVLLKEINPDLIICNSSESSKIFDKENNKNNICYWNNIPVILSGQITGNKKPDNYNMIRIIKQIKEEFKEIYEKKCNTKSGQRDFCEKLKKCFSKN